MNTPITTKQSTPPQPLLAEQRAILPDVLRGLAIWGILLVNVQDFSGYNEWQQQGLDRIAQIWIDMFANGRFISIFAMLFGWGAAGFLERHGLLLYSKRNAMLILLGVLHFILLWHGDIVRYYGFVGLFGVPFLVRMSAPQLLKLIAALLVGGAVLAAGASVFINLGAQTDPQLLADLQAPRQSVYPAFPEPASYGNLVWDRLISLWAYFKDQFSYSLHLIALFSLGIVAHKLQILSRPQEHLALFQRLMWWGLPLGAILGGVLAWQNTLTTEIINLEALPVRLIGGLATALGYVGIFGYLVAKQRLGIWAHLAQNGRLAFSNYIGQSLCMTLFFYPYAGAQFGKWGAAASLGLALLFGFLQIFASGWIIKKFGRGPLEALLRWTVYGRTKRAS